MMKKHTEPIECDRFYHIYNRGINGETIFKENRNYAFFLQKYAFYIQPVAETYAYCLLKNHFHLLIRTRTPAEIVENIANLKKNADDFGKIAAIESKAAEGDFKDQILFANKQISNQFAKLFNSYAQSINKAHRRTGALLEDSFRRILVDSDGYFQELVYYIHSNPEKHGFVADFRDYPHSSYLAHLSKLDTKLSRTELLELFGNADSFHKYHLSNQILQNLDKYEIEFD